MGGIRARHRAWLACRHTPTTLLLTVDVGNTQTHFGTAITYDVVSGAGEYLGGIITPGVEISMEALTERGAKLPKVEIAEPRSLIGMSTVDAIRSGIVFGYAGQVDGILKRLRAELGSETRTIATGGLAMHVVPFTEPGSIDRVDDLLTLKGLRLLHQRAEQPS